MTIELPVSALNKLNEVKKNVEITISYNILGKKWEKFYNIAIDLLIFFA